MVNPFSSFARLLWQQAVVTHLDLLFDCRAPALTMNVNLRPMSGWSSLDHAGISNKNASSSRPTVRGNPITSCGPGIVMTDTFSNATPETTNCSDTPSKLAERITKSLDGSCGCAFNKAAIASLCGDDFSPSRLKTKFCPTFIGTQTSRHTPIVPRICNSPLSCIPNGKTKPAASYSR